MRAWLVASVLLVAGCIGPSLDAEGGPPTTPSPSPSEAPATQPPQDWIRITPSHGSAMVRVGADLDGLALEYGTGSQALGRANVSAGTETLIPFLDGGKEYWYRVGDRNGTFRTEPDPYRWADADKALVQPGASILTDVGACSMAFLFRDATNQSIYALTAGHCTSRVGEPVELMGGQVFGAVAYREFVSTGYPGSGDPDPPRSKDWGLIRIHDEVRDQTSPSVRHWTGPTGVVGEEDLKFNDVVCIYGWGSPLGVASTETYPRCGEFKGYGYEAEWDGTHYYAALLVGGGDSGAPIIAHETGQALGIIASTAVNTISDGPTLCSIEDYMRAAGFDLRLITAPYRPPDADPGPWGPVPLPYSQETANCDAWPE